MTENASMNQNTTRDTNAAGKNNMQELREKLKGKDAQAINAVAARLGIRPDEVEQALDMLQKFNGMFNGMF